MSRSSSRHLSGISSPGSDLSASAAPSLSRTMHKFCTPGSTSSTTHNLRNPTREKCRRHGSHGGRGRILYRESSSYRAWIETCPAVEDSNRARGLVQHDLSDGLRRSWRQSRSREGTLMNHNPTATELGEKSRHPPHQQVLGIRSGR